MKSRRYLYGLMGLLSLLGFIGVFSEEKVFLFFFAFAVDFEYFFMKSDEMLEKHMDQSASRAFYFGMITTAVATLVCFFVKNQTGANALFTGFSLGWTVSVVVHALSTAYYGFRENWGLAHDQE